LDLVPDVLSDSSFWFSQKLRLPPEKKFSRHRLEEAVQETPPLRMGVSASLLSDIKNMIKEDVNGAIKVRLTSSLIQSIFRVYPTVKQKYDENISKISEETFWKNFIESVLVYESRGTGIVEGAEVSFHDCLMAEHQRYMNLLNVKQNNLLRNTQPFESGSLKEEGYYEEEKGEVDSKIRQVNAMSGLILQQEYAESLNSNAEGELLRDSFQAKPLEIRHGDRYCSSFVNSPDSHVDGFF
jgi:hypothetical protein